jgi:hypothetical protein
MAKSSGIGELVGWGIAGVGVWWIGSLFGWWTDLFGGGTSVPTTTAVSPGPNQAVTTPTTTAPPSTTTTPAPTVSLAGTVTASSNNGLQANVSINGSVQNMACIPGGQCYNTSGQGIALPAGVTAAQIYALMLAAYVPARPPVTPTKKTATVVLAGPVSAGVHSGSLKASVTINGSTQVLSCSPSLGCYNSAGQGYTLPSGVTVAQIYALMQAAAPKGVSGYGMGGGIVPAGVPIRVPGAKVMVHAGRRNYVPRGSGY